MDMDHRIMNPPGHGYTDPKVRERKEMVDFESPCRLGYFYGAKCSRRALVPVPLIESVLDDVTRSINDLDVRCWVDATPLIGGIRKCDEGRRIVPLPPFMQSLKGMHSYVIFYVPPQRSRIWAVNQLMRDMYPERPIKGDVLVMKMISSSNIGDMSPLDVRDVEELLMRALSHRWFK